MCRLKYQLVSRVLLQIVECVTFEQENPEAERVFEWLLLIVDRENCETKQFCPYFKFEAFRNREVA